MSFSPKMLRLQAVAVLKDVYKRQVLVDGEHNFKYADGTRYYPMGTTAYAWTHMKEGA